jgi:DNA-binding Lrp family transcriptional regulator
MAYKLDLKDKKILYELDIDSRIPTTKLAKKVGLSQPACHYRLNNLISKGVIKFFLANIDYGFFGYFPYRFFTKLQNITEEKEKELINYLKNHEFIPFLSSCTGRYELMFCVMAKNISGLKNTVNEIKNKYGEYFIEQQIATIISGEFYPRDYFLGKDKRARILEKEFGEQTNRPKLDKKDFMILSEISNDCRISSLELSEKIKLSLDAVRYRLKNLEKNKIINGFTVYLDNELINQLRHKIMIQINGPNEEKENKIIGFARQFSNVVYSVKTFGAWDLELDIEVDTPEKFNKILREIKNNCPGIIKEYNTIQLTTVHKYTHLPMKAESLF